jgi:hypothetical protein
MYVSNYTNRRSGLREYRAPDGDKMRNLRGELGQAANQLVGCMYV